VVLDSCFAAIGDTVWTEEFQWTDANILAGLNSEWLEPDLKASGQTGDRVCFIKRLDVTKQSRWKNMPIVRKVFEASGGNVAVFKDIAIRKRSQ